jgi:hypothetical protein
MRRLALASGSDAHQFDFFFQRPLESQRIVPTSETVLARVKNTGNAVALPSPDAELSTLNPGAAAQLS